MTRLSSKHLQQFIDRENIRAEILFMDQHTPSVPEAAAALDVEPFQIIKSLLFRVKEEPILVISCGLTLIDRRKIAKHVQVGRSRIKLVSPEQALIYSGYVVGSMPPFGHLLKLRTLIDPAVRHVDEVFGGGGDLNTMMRLSTLELVRVTSAEIVDVSVEKSNPDR